MAKDTQGAQLAHIADTVTELNEQFGTFQETQGAVLAILTRLVETAEAQSEMLADVLGAARGDPGPSPVAAQLEKLTAAVEHNNAAVREMTDQLASLPEQIGAAVAGAGDGAQAAKPA